MTRRATAVLAVDQGTSGTKALVVDPERGVIGRADVELRPEYGPGGSVEIAASALLDSVVEAGRRALAEAEVPVAAFGLANQGESVLAWDRRTGQPLSSAIVWQDRRSAALCDELAGRSDGLAEELHAISGLTLDPYFAAPKMAWLLAGSASRWPTGRDPGPDLAITTSDAWLVHQLTGAFISDVSTASRTMLLDLDRRVWSTRALEIFGLDHLVQPRLVDCAGPVGHTRVFAGAGVQPDDALPLTGLIVDQQAALAAQGCLARGQAKCTYGTGAFLLATLGPEPIRSAQGLPTSVAWQIGDQLAYCADGQVYTVASAVRWLADLGVIDSATDLDRLAGMVPDAGGTMFVPALAGLAAPLWRPRARGLISGLSLATTRGHLVRALLEGIAAEVADLALTMTRQVGVAVESLKADGGLTRSSVLMQTQADLLQAPVEVSSGSDATALGAAAMAAVGAGLAADLATAVASIAASADSTSIVTGDPGASSARYEPRIAAAAAADQLAAYRQARNLT